MLTEEKLARINASLDQHQRFIDETTLKSARPLLGRDGERRGKLRAARAQGGVRRLCARRRKRGPARARSQGAVGRQQSGRRLPGAGRARARDRPQAHRDLADPLDRRRARDQRQRLQEAVHDDRPRGRLGRRDRGAHADRLAGARRAVVPGDGALRHAGRDRRRCWRTPPSTSTSGSPPRSSRPSPCRRAPPSSPATAPTSRRASSPTPRSPTRRGSGRKLGYIATGAAGAFPASDPVRRAGRPDLRAQGRLPAERRVRDEPQDAGHGAQVQGHDRRLSLAAAGGGGRPRLADDLRGDRGRGHAGRRGQLATRWRSAISAAAI